VILGQVKRGAVAERKVILRGARPFKIVRVEGDDGMWRVQESSDRSKPVHVLTVSLKAKKVGETRRVIKITTDLREDGEIRFQARAQVIP
jgi:hypothetical protein